MTLVEEYPHLVYKIWMDFTKSQLTRIKGPFYIQIFEMENDNGCGVSIFGVKNLDLF